jgi:hypothetical protein
MFRAGRLTQHMPTRDAGTVNAWTASAWTEADSIVKPHVNLRPDFVALRVALRPLLQHVRPAARQGRWHAPESLLRTMRDPYAACTIHASRPLVSKRTAYHTLAACPGGALTSCSTRVRATNSIPCRPPCGICTFVMPAPARTRLILQSPSSFLVDV